MSRYAYAAKAAATTPPTTPDGWPDGWTFPPDDAGPWPPGWPIDDPGTVTLEVTAADIIIGSAASLICKCLDALGADIATFNLHLVKVSAAIGANVVQLKKLVGDAWSAAIYYQVTNYAGASYGFSATPYYNVAIGDLGSTVTVTCEVVSVEPPVEGTDTATVVLEYAKWDSTGLYWKAGP